LLPKKSRRAAAAVVAKLAQRVPLAVVMMKWFILFVPFDVMLLL